MQKLSQTKQVKEKFVTGQTAQRRSMGFRMLLMALIGLFIVLSILVKTRSPLSLDLIITQNVQQISSSGFGELMRILTFLGNPIPALMTLGLLSLILLTLNRKVDSLFLILSSAGATFISEAAKLVVARPRPDPALINQIGIFTRQDSFPSGHVLLFIGIYGYLFYLCYTGLKKGLLQAFLIGLCLLLLILIGVSRIYLGAHWFSDVLGSFLIGSVWIFCVIFLESKFKKTS